MELISVIEIVGITRRNCEESYKITVILFKKERGGKLDPLFFFLSNLFLKSIDSIKNFYSIRKSTPPHLPPRKENLAFLNLTDLLVAVFQSS